MKQLFSILFFCILFSFSGKATQMLGGDLTWKCQGTGYVFTLTYYRDCNGKDITGSSVTVDVWNHPSITTITLNFLSRQDVSPSCKQVNNSPPPITCGIGPGGGSAPGAIEKLVYVSDPITLDGTPPSQGWVFTFQETQRSGSVTNLTSPASYGITIAAKMYKASNVANGCVDSSPLFLQDPVFSVCSGKPVIFNSNPIDPDIDPIKVTFDQPYGNFSGGLYSPPVSPSPVPFEPGFYFDSPTPDTTINPANIGAKIDTITGEIKFTSYTAGTYSAKILVRSFRNNKLIAVVEREMQFYVTNCDMANNMPIVTPPFVTSFNKTVIAGANVQFTLNIADNETLQDGSFQNTIVTPTGYNYGTNFTATTGCEIEPCAKLNNYPIINSKGASLNFSWQTTCDHLANQYGVVADEIPYVFVFKVQDDYCPIPNITYVTVKITVTNPGVIPGTQITCIQTDSLGNNTINWKPVTNSSSSFIEYRVNTIQDGVIATISNINTTTFIHLNQNQSKDYFVTVVSGCGGKTPRHSDTISSIFIKVINPNDGRASISWNTPFFSPIKNFKNYYYLYREYPKGQWVLRDSFPLSKTFCFDTIDVCQANLRYKIVLKNTYCNFISNLDGGLFKDIIRPISPSIKTVSIDTLSNFVKINWNNSWSTDTKGYYVYIQNADGSWSQLSTLLGRFNNQYIYSPNINNTSLTYSIAAFDSCGLVSNKANPHTTIFLKTKLDYCTYEVTYTWDKYIGVNNLLGYEVWGKIKGKTWQLLKAVSDTNTTQFFATPYLEYTFVIKGFTSDGRIVFSNPKVMKISAPNLPKFNYIRNVSPISNTKMKIAAYVDTATNVQDVILYKFNSSSFIEISRQPLSTTNMYFYDYDVKTDRYNYQYKTTLLDSCGNEINPSNIVKPMLLKVKSDQNKGINYLEWSPYSDYAGSLLEYKIYRGIDGIMDSVSYATVNSGQNFYEDKVQLDDTVIYNGHMCYYIIAVEGDNKYGFKEKAHSNIVCPITDPLIYLPNTFTPDGNEYNQEFIPIMEYFEYSRYKFTIFDSWEHMVFESSDPAEGWGGQVLNTGKPAMAGTYAYRLSLYDGNGREIVKRGFVVLLR